MFIGQPVFKNESLGWVFNIAAGNPNLFVIGGGGLTPAGSSVSVVWENGRLSHGIDESTAAVWLRRVPPTASVKTAEKLAALVEAATEKEQAEREARDAEHAARAEREAAFKADAATRVPEWAKAVIIAERRVDESDSMSDYHGSRTEQVLILGFSKHNRDLFPEMKKAAAHVEEVAHLAGERYDLRPVFVADVNDDGHYFHRGSLSHWHRDETPAEPFTSEAAALAYVEAHPLESIQFGETVAEFEWSIKKRDFEHREKYSMGAGFYLKDGHRDADGWGIRKVSIDGPRSVPIGEWRLAKTPKKRTPRADHNTASAHLTQELGQNVEVREGTKPGYSEVIFQDKPDEETRASLKAAGFRWSRHNGCWYGLTSSLPLEYLEEAEEIYTLRGEGTLSEGGEVIAKVTNASIHIDRTGDKLRALDDGMQKSIDDKLGEKQTNTVKRLAQAAHSRLKGEREQRAQQALYALADLRDAGTVPPVLVKLKSKAAAIALVGTKTEMAPNGFHTYHICTGEPISTSPEAVALWSLLEGKTPEEKAAEELRRTIEGLQFTKIPGYFPTPPAVVAEMMERADIREGDAVGEFSAGSGYIADAIYENMGIKPDCCEINYTLRGILEAKGHNLIGDDFMGLLPAGSYCPNDGAVAPCRYDRVLLNPPFENMQDVDHVKHAYQFLKPGGRLVSIMSPSAFTNSTHKASDFREWFDRMGGERIDLPEGSFKESNTGVNTVLVVIDREG